MAGAPLIAKARDDHLVSKEARPLRANGNASIVKPMLTLALNGKIITIPPV